MALKAAFVVMAPDGDPDQHRASIKTSQLEVTTEVVELMNIEQAIAVCTDLVENEGVQALVLCPGFSHEAVARVANAVDEEIPVSVARGDIPTAMKTVEVLTKEAWLPEQH